MTQKTQLTATQLKALQRSVAANGREQAWTFVVKKHWDLDVIREHLADKETHRRDPDAQKGSMKAGASPRLFIDDLIDPSAKVIIVAEITVLNFITAHFVDLRRHLQLLILFVAGVDAEVGVAGCRGWIALPEIASGIS